MSTTIEPTVRVETARREPMPPRERLETMFAVDGLDAIYSGKTAVKDVTMEVYKNLVTAIIGPSGCGKSTFIRCFNRMNDLMPGFAQTGHDPLPRPGHLRARHRPGRRPAEHRHGLPAARTRSRSRSWTTSPGASQVLGMKDDLDERVERR